MDETIELPLECRHVTTYTNFGGIRLSQEGCRWEVLVARTTLTSREFNQDTSGAKKAARRGPVFITDRGRPAHVLLTIEDYQRLTGNNTSLAETLAQPGVADFEFEPPRLRDGIFKPADFE